MIHAVCVSYCQVLFHSLPVMLERCVDYKLISCGAEPIVIDQAVDFLQALLDLMTEVHVHLEVCRLWSAWSSHE